MPPLNKSKLMKANGFINLLAVILVILASSKTAQPNYKALALQQGSNEASSYGHHVPTATNLLSSSPAAATTATAAAKQQDTPIYLESIEDLEHVAYLSMRNFNITDEGLLQLNWLLSLGNALQHKQKVSSASSPLSGSHDLKGRLALMLESFISHLRNGHLRRLSLEELESIVGTLNQTPSEAQMITTTTATTTTAMAMPLEAPKVEVIDGKSPWLARKLDGEQPLAASASGEPIVKQEPDRCDYLVSIYKFELRERQNSLARQQSRIEYEQAIYSQEQQIGEQIDETRLAQLCQLAVKCHSAEELVSLVSGPWRNPSSAAASGAPEVAQVASSGSNQANQQPNGEKRRRRREDQFEWAEKWSEGSPLAASSSSQSNERLLPNRKSLRDSLSMSLAKLCPLILFQLHDDDGLCSVRRDDRPPMITVWGFATLFVTIVSFCSLIGLSITPLLGPTAASSSSGSSEASESPTRMYPMQPSHHHRHHHRHHRQQQQHQFYQHPSKHPNNPASYNSATFGSSSGPQQHHHRGALTLFEGLAVGSLVGSALFSLIPQAFELQERETNRGFLLKALIIFFGIYLFFCSERIMRIILDTRQQRKKRKRLTHRSSNSIPIPSTTQDFELQLPQQHSSRVSQSTSLPCGGQTIDCHHDGKMVAGKLRRQQQQVEPFQHPTRSAGKTCAEIGSPKAVSFPCKKQEQTGANPAAEKALSNAAAVAIADQQEDLVHQQQRHQRGSKVRRRKTRQQLLLSKRKRRKAANKQRQRAAGSCSEDEEKQQLNRAHRQPSSSSASSASSYSPSSSSFHSSSPIRSSSSATRGRSERQRNKLGEDGDISDGPRGSSPTSDDSGAEGPQQARSLGATKRRHLDHLGARQSPSARQQLAQHHARTRKTSFQLDTNNKEPQRSGETVQQAQESKQDISTVAWMIVLGDGLHNFIDGISIGAAFSESILSGVSISVAVICEEFPHELGDFAVLVSSGMTVRQALGYNFLSACTCYFGMAVGIILGDVNDGASYISALAAGVFLYIALVDMMGELSATLEKTSRDSIAKTLKLLLLQNVGIFIGISIIFILSFIDF